MYNKGFVTELRAINRLKRSRAACRVETLQELSEPSGRLGLGLERG